MYLTIGLAVVVVATIAILLIVSSNSIKRMKDVTFKRSDVKAGSQTADHWRLWEDFAKTREMKPIGHFVTQPLTPVIMSAWRCPKPASFFVLHTVPGKSEMEQFRGVEFVTILDSDAGTTLTTTTKSDGLTIPAGPGSWVQCFPESTGTQLAQAHEKGLSWLNQKKSIKADVQPADFPKITAHCVQTQVRSFIQNRKFPLVALWRFVVARHMEAGKSVWNQ